MLALFLLKFGLRFSQEFTYRKDLKFGLRFSQEFAYRKEPGIACALATKLLLLLQSCFLQFSVMNGAQTLAHSNLKAGFHSECLRKELVEGSASA
jgi:hypothetical protein